MGTQTQAARRGGPCVNCYLHCQAGRWRYDCAHAQAARGQCGRSPAGSSLGTCGPGPALLSSAAAAWAGQGPGGCLKQNRAKRCPRTRCRGPAGVSPPLRQRFGRLHLFIFSAIRTQLKCLVCLVFAPSDARLHFAGLRLGSGHSPGRASAAAGAAGGGRGREGGEERGPEDELLQARRSRCSPAPPHELIPGSAHRDDIMVPAPSPQREGARRSRAGKN